MLTAGLLRAGPMRAAMKPSTITRVFTRRAIHSTRPRLQQQSGQDVGKQLSWNDFLALRLRRRKVNFVCSCACAVGAVGIGWIGVSGIEIDPTQMIMGFDPLVVMSAGLVVCAGMGYLVGPSLGDFVFKSVLIRKQASAFSKKNADFLRHIQKNRPDPSKQSYGNPVTDFYGEKIGSLKDYRQWLRDGKAYKRKSEKFL